MYSVLIVLGLDSVEDFFFFKFLVSTKDKIKANQQVRNIKHIEFVSVYFSRSDAVVWMVKPM